MLNSYLIRDLQLPAPNGPYSPVRASSLLQTVVLNQAVMVALNHVDIFNVPSPGNGKGVCASDVRRAVPPPSMPQGHVPGTDRPGRKRRGSRPWAIFPFALGYKFYLDDARLLWQCGWPCDGTG